MSNNPAERHKIAGEVEPPALSPADPRDAALAKAREALKNVRQILQWAVDGDAVDQEDVEHINEAIAALDAAKG